MKKLCLISAVACLFAMAIAASPAHAESDGAVTCRNASIPVALAQGEPPNYLVSGELCATEGEPLAGTTVQLLIHGATYNHEYWDFGEINGIQYSYARDVAARGFPTFDDCEAYVQGLGEMQFAVVRLLWTGGSRPADPSLPEDDRQVHERNRREVDLMALRARLENPEKSAPARLAPIASDRLPSPALDRSREKQIEPKRGGR